jgi:hypothetical protein
MIALHAFDDTIFVGVATLCILFVLWVVAVRLGVDPRGDK